MNIAKQCLFRLKNIRPGNSHLILVNHVCFVDPHIVLELSFKGRFCVNLLAGIEPFDMARGIFGWHMQSVGGFSIDRGILDRISLQTAQSILDEGYYPLVIFPEGEAAYTNKTLQPFYPGASLFAINTAEKLKTSSRSVFITPIAIYYRFQGSPDSTIRKSIKRLFNEVADKTRKIDTTLFYNQLDETAPIWEQLQLVINISLTYLEKSYQNFLCNSMELSLQCRIERLRDFIIEELLTEHYPDENLSYRDDLMTIKNRLRSIIARKRHAPAMEELQSAIDQVQQILSSYQEIGLSERNLKKLKSLEMQWIGIFNGRDNIDKRLKKLIKHLVQQKPYAEIKLNASEDDLQRWERHINDTRRVKMLTLLINDLKIKDESWEGIDEVLVKLEILLFSRFVYRHNKEAFINIGEPVDLKQFLNENTEWTKKDQQEHLTKNIKQRFEQLFIDLPIDFNNYMTEKT